MFDYQPIPVCNIVKYTSNNVGYASMLLLSLYAITPHNLQSLPSCFDPNNVQEWEEKRRKHQQQIRYLSIKKSDQYFLEKRSELEIISGRETKF